MLSWIQILDHFTTSLSIGEYAILGDLLARATIAWLGVKPVDSDKLPSAFCPDAHRPLQKSQNGVDADQDDAIPQS